MKSIFTAQVLFNGEALRSFRLEAYELEDSSIVFYETQNLMKDDVLFSHIGSGNRYSTPAYLVFSTKEISVAFCGSFAYDGNWLMTITHQQGRS